MRLSRTYRKWDSMIARCTRPSHPSFAYYGARGVAVCERWLGSYAAFLADMGEAPPGLWLDRIDNAKGYEPGNCRWVTPKESAKNRGKTGAPRDPDSLAGKARAANMPYYIVYQRVTRGWPVEKALSVPMQSLGGMTHHDKATFGLM